MNLLLKRGIPGVASDTYHLGFFEDSTAHNMDRVIHTRYDSLLDALTLFFLILTIYLLLAVVLFGIREYTFAMRRRKRQIISDENWFSENVVEIPLNNALNANLLTPLGHRSTLKNNTSMIEPIEGLSNLPGMILEGSSCVSLPELYSRASLDSKDDPDVSLFELFAPIEVVKISGDFTPESCDAYAMSALRSASLKRINRSGVRPRQIYSIKEISAMKPVEYNGIPLIRSDVSGSLSINNISQAVRLSFPIDRLHFDGAYAAEKELSDIAIHITNEKHTSRSELNMCEKLALFKFIAIGANSTTLQNPNIFLPTFNITLGYLIDSGLMFDLLENTNVYKARQLVDIIIQYCYAHWFYESPGAVNSNSLRNHFKRWKFNGPNVQQHHVIFRYLINMFLGLQTTTNLESDTSTISTNKVKFMMLHCIENTNCHDYIGMIPLLSQAIDFSEKQESQILFYKCLYQLIKKHANCCMDGDFFTDRGLLKGLVQSGLYYLNPRPIRNYTCDILFILTLIDSKYQMWADEVRGGKILLSSTPRLNQASEYDHVTNVPRGDETISLEAETTSTETAIRTPTTSPGRNWDANVISQNTQPYLNSQSHSQFNTEHGSNGNIRHVAPKSTPGYFFKR